MAAHRTPLLVVVIALSGSACVHELSGDLDEAIADPAAEEAAIAPAPFFAGDPDHGAVFAIDISFWEGTIAEQEMDCFWDSGVRHVVAGAQVEEITRQQLELAERRGMTLDAYVYLYWDDDIAAQVEEAFAIAGDFPLGRMWLDVEQDPAGLGSNALIADVDEAVQRCRELGDPLGVDCGIYTGPGYWKGHMANTARFADVPLWYAWYNGKRLLSSWTSERFGGWAAPAAKQWAEEVLCGVGVDKDTMQVLTAPSVVVDRTVPPYDGRPPPAPAGLYPTDGGSTALDQVKLSVTPLPHAQRYELALESWSGSSWRSYYTWGGPNAFRLVSPVYDDTSYRFRARAKNAAGWGAWSSWSVFHFGAPESEPPPSSSPPPPSSSPPPASDPPPPANDPPPSSSPPPAPVDGAPANLAPDGGSVASASVTLSCDPVVDATRYQFAIEYLDDAGAAHAYYTYEKAGPSATYWPQISGVTYRFQVRALVGGAWGAWSAAASFAYP